MNVPSNLKYTKDHEWILVEGATGTVGITDFAQGELGDVVFVELPKVGKEVKKGDSFGTIEAVKAVSDLFAPVAGSIIAVNEELSAAPETVNKDPYGSGWMVKLRFSNPDELADLMDAVTYQTSTGK